MRQPLTLRQEALVACTLALAFAIFTCFVSNNIEPRFLHRYETIQQQLAILTAEASPLDGVPVYFGAFQNRVLFPLALGGLSSLFRVLSIGQWYLILRLATAFGCALAVWWLLRKQAGARPKLAAVGLAVLAYDLVFTFNHGWEHPTDFPDAAFTALWLWAVLEQRRFSVLGLALLAAVNRESAAFAGVVWMVVWGFSARPKLNVRELHVRELAFGAGLSVVTYATVLGVRWVHGGVKAFEENSNTSDVADTLPRLGQAIIDFLHQPTPSSWPVLTAAMVIVPVGWVWVNRAWLTNRDRRLLYASGLTFLLSLPFSKFEEPRDFMTSIILLLFVAVSAEAAAGRQVVSAATLNGGAAHTTNGVHAVRARTG